MLAHDMFNQFVCVTEKKEAACNAPKALDQYEKAFELTQPLCNPKIIMSILKRNFPKSLEMMQAGATVTVGSALFSLIYPIKFGFFGYLMVLFGLYTEGISPFLPGLAFLPIFAVATDVGSIFKNHVSRAAPATPQADDTTETKGTPAAAADTSSKRGNNKKKKRV